MLVLTIASVSNAQNVDIPDTAFLHALIDAGVDTNGDSLISYAEAEMITYLDVSELMCGRGCEGFGEISDMTGIEAFINLDSLNFAGNKIVSIDLSMNNDLLYLNCGYNNFSNLDVSNNTALTELSCWNNQLTNLDVSNNTALEVLYCGINPLSNLDVSNNTALIELDCRWNQLTNLYVSNNTALTKLLCGNNQLTNLDVSNNNALKHLSLSNMHTLNEVCVWKDFSLDSISVLTESSPNVYFKTDCAVNIQDDFNKNSSINIYPNPSDDIINIEIENPDNATIEIYNVSGRLIFSKELNSKAEKIDVSDFFKGIYIVKVMQNSTVYYGKIMVR